jgi:hypothetical protein
MELEKITTNEDHLFHYPLEITKVILLLYPESKSLKAVLKRIKKKSKKLRRSKKFKNNESAKYTIENAKFILHVLRLRKQASSTLSL